MNHAVRSHQSSAFVRMLGALLVFPVLSAFADEIVLDGSDYTINVASGTKSITAIRGVKSKIIKTGAGDLSLEVKSDLISAIEVTAGTLSFRNVDFALGDPESAAIPDVSVSGNGTVLAAYRPVVFGNLTLNGATLRQKALISIVAAGTTSAAVPGEEPATFRAFAVNGTLAVTGDSTVEAPLALSSVGTTEFAIDAGATLTVSQLCVGHAADGTPRANVGFTKTGAGTLSLAGAAGVGGTVDCRAGAIRLAKDARFAADANVTTASGAKIVLEDGAVLPTDGGAAAVELLRTANVWFDATHISAADGAAVSSVPNRGTAGGAFRLYTEADAPEATRMTGAPVYRPAAINGRPALHFEGAQALGLWSYTNRASDVSVYYVARITAFQSYRSPFSLNHLSATADDRAEKGALHVQVNDNVGKTQLIGVSAYQEIVINNSARAVNTPYLDMIRKSSKGMGITEYVGEGVDDVSMSSTSTSFTGNMNVDIVCLGGRSGKNGAPIYCYADSRLYLGDIGEFLVFSRALNDDESAKVEAYLKAKWFGAEKDGWKLVKSAPLSVEVASGTAVAEGVLAKVDGGDALVKSGAGTLRVGGTANPDARLAVAGGAVSFSGAEIASRADIWADAADYETFTFDASGKISQWRNKGRCGGSFHQTGAQFGGAEVTGDTPLPSYSATGFDGKRPSVYFDRNSALMLDTYENKRDTRSLYVYAVMKIGTFQQWGAPFSFSTAASTANDNVTAGSFHVPDETTSKFYYYISTAKGSGYTSLVTRTDPHLFVSRQDAFGGVFSFEAMETPTDQVPTFACAGSAKMDVDRVLVGGRLGPGGNAQFAAVNSGSNRLWGGYMGEFIVFTDPLGYAEEKALLDYLRDKWLGKASVVAKRPGFLDGKIASCDFAAGTLAPEDGAKVVQEGPCVELDAIEAGDGVTWSFPEEVPTGFSVANGMAFGSAQTIELGYEPTAKSLLFSGSVTRWTPSAWKVAPAAGTTFVDSYGARYKPTQGIGVSRRTGMIFQVR